MSAGFATVTVMCLLIVLGTLVQSASAQTFRWSVTAPEQANMSSEKLGAITRDLAAHGTDCFVVVRRGRVAWEWYAPGWSKDKPHYIASLSKSMVGGMSLLAAIEAKKLSPDDLASKYIPEWKKDPKKSKITVRHLASHTSGLSDASHDKDLPESRFWQYPHHYTYARDTAPMRFQPGRGRQYSNPGMAMLGVCITRAMKDTTLPDIKTILRERVMKPIGASRGWGISFYGGGRPVKYHGLKLYATWGGGTSTARVAARVGRLMLRGGRWPGKRVFKQENVALMLKDAGGPDPDRTKDPAAPRSGLCWWLNLDGVWEHVPKDAFAGAGAQNQLLFVVPSLDLVVVRFGRKSLGRAFWRGAELHLFTPVVEACTDVRRASGGRRFRIQPSPVIKGIRFAPVSSIVRKGEDSDNWPMTWADDGALYTAYGDGWGFKPRTKRKRSNGIAKISGGPARFKGVNIRTTTGETIGDGHKGAKASGMLMVDGVLFMWMRNVGNAELWWSADHGKTWQRARWKFKTSFGCPTFVNFGKNYAGARDHFVYVASQDGPSAYENYDGVVLARVRKDRLARRASYEFFAGRDAAGLPTWTDDVTKRQRILTNPGRCARMDVVYHPVLKRYLMAIAARNGKGAWALFDAPEPWGPWTVVHETDDWGLGDTHGFRIPTKWLSKDGRTLCIVFSGRPHKGVNWDSFCVRKATLLLP